VGQLRSHSPKSGASRSRETDDVYLRVEPSERRTHNRGTPEGGPPRYVLVAMIQGTFAEIPGLALQIPQAARLFVLRPEVCQVVLEDLVTVGRLRRLPDGRYTGA
jgi:hypothetical protein